MPTNQTPLQRPRRLSLGHEAEMSCGMATLPNAPPSPATTSGARPGSITATGC